MDNTTTPTPFHQTFTTREAAMNFVMICVAMGMGEMPDAIAVAREWADQK